jgi:hypothetical protein
LYEEELDKELTKLIGLSLILAKVEPHSPEAKQLVKNLEEAYKIGFKKGFRAAKQEDMPWYLTDKEEAEYWKRNNIDDRRR